jgi:DEAD/DEAH box helicase domain-containing protein
MMRKIVFDIETKNAGTNGKLDVRDLEISVVGIHDSKTDTYHCFLENEFGELWKILETATLLIGYNSNYFDVPILNRYYPGDLTRIKSIDLLHEIKKSGGRRVRLDAVAEGTLGKKKSGHGLQAITWWENGEIEKLKSYCLDDVRLTKELYDYALQHGVLRYISLGDTRDVKLNTSDWEEKDEASMTHTLPF